MNHRQTPCILVFTTSYLPLVGGAETALYEITKRTSGARVVIFTSRMRPDLPYRENDGLVLVRRFGFGNRLDKWLLPFFVLPAALQEIARHKKAILWGIMISQATIGAYFVKLLRPRVPLVVTLQEGDHEDYLEGARFGLIDLFWRVILRKADGVTAISKYLAKRAAKKGYQKKVEIIPNGVSEQFVSESFERPRKESFGIRDGEQVILSVSRLVEKNGIDILIRAVARLQGEGLSTRLILAGDGKDKEKLERLADTLEIRHSIIFAGHISYEKTLFYYKLSDVFVRPSRSEGLGSAFLEAMGAGIPVVATPVGGIVDFIVDHETGLFAKPNNVEDTARAIREVIENPELKAALSKNGRDLVIQKYMWVDIAARMEDFLLKQAS